MRHTQMVTLVISKVTDQHGRYNADKEVVPISKLQQGELEHAVGKMAPEICRIVKTAPCKTHTCKHMRVHMCTHAHTHAP